MNTMNETRKSARIKNRDATLKATLMKINNISECSVALERCSPKDKIYVAEKRRYMAEKDRRKLIICSCMFSQ